MNTNLSNLKNKNTNGNLVIHLMIYDLESHKKHVIESFTCLDWVIQFVISPNLRDIFPVLILQILDFKTARRNIDDYRFEFKEKNLVLENMNFQAIQIMFKLKNINKFQISFRIHVSYLKIFNI